MSCITKLNIENDVENCSIKLIFSFSCFRLADLEVIGYFCKYFLRLFDVNLATKNFGKCDFFTFLRSFTSFSWWKFIDITSFLWIFLSCRVFGAFTKLSHRGIEGNFHKLHDCSITIFPSFFYMDKLLNASFSAYNVELLFLTGCGNVVTKKSFLHVCFQNNLEITD